MVQNANINPIEFSKISQSLIVLEFPGFLSELKTELKLIEAILFNCSKNRLIRIEQIEDSIGNRIVKKTRNPEETHRYQKDPWRPQSHRGPP